MPKKESPNPPRVTVSKRELDAVRRLVLEWRGAPAEQRDAAVLKIAEAISLVQVRNRPIGAPMRWTPEWRQALCVFVDRRVVKASLGGLPDGPSLGTKRFDQLARKRALNEAIKHEFPFRNPTLAAAKQQYSIAKQEIDCQLELAASIRCAIFLEFLFEVCHGSIDLFDAHISNIGAHPVSTGVKETLQATGFILPADPPLRK